MAAAEAEPSAGEGWRPNPEARVGLVRIGRSGEPVVVVDEALIAPERLVEAAAALEFAPADRGRGGFPGIRAAAPAQLGSALLKAAAPTIERIFGLERERLRIGEAAFSLVTAHAQDLHPLQRLPHLDTRDPRRLAMLLYLGRGQMGGTAFYRQDSTGLEQVGPAEFEAYRTARGAELAGLSPGGGFPDRETPGYTETAHFEARFNRLLVYRSCSLHSGAIPPDLALSADPKRGRLTANIFVDFAAD